MNSLRAVIGLFCLFLTFSTAALAQNTPPTLTAVSTISGAGEDATYYIEGATLFNRADEFDADGDALTFRVEQVLSGTLTRSDGTTIYLTRFNRWFKLHDSPVLQDCFFARRSGDFDRCLRLSQ